MSASAIGVGLRSGEFELGRDLSPRISKRSCASRTCGPGSSRPRRRGRTSSSSTRRAARAATSALRQALAGVTRARISCGPRSAVSRCRRRAPAARDPRPRRRRRRPLLPADQARALRSDAGSRLLVRLSAAVHPILQDRYKALTAAALRDLEGDRRRGRDRHQDMGVYLEAQARGTADLRIGRWIADYDDPDNFTYALFDSADGSMRKLLLLARDGPSRRRGAHGEQAGRPRGALPEVREPRSSSIRALIPLFHDVDYRIAAPASAGSRLGQPAVHQLCRDREGRGGRRGARDPGRRHHPGPDRGRRSEHRPGDRMATFEQAESLVLVFETLTRDDEGARIIPWLASEVVPGGRRRPASGSASAAGSAFTTAAPLTARDVRHSFERLLQTRTSEARFLSPVRGAQRLLYGRGYRARGLPRRSLPPSSSSSSSGPCRSSPP